MLHLIYVSLSFIYGMSIFCMLVHTTNDVRLSFGGKTVQSIAHSVNNTLPCGKCGLSNIKLTPKSPSKTTSFWHFQRLLRFECFITSLVLVVAFLLTHPILNILYVLHISKIHAFNAQQTLHYEM